ncbi:hypothetical protein G7Y89_g12140 [Cudoniella acicularis]|uniref:Peptidase S33 tripeptidyl aminopeptidase-like C-terminal domain-containing protein n=1 Tax=Cudoniella acicularis TaxID=354080 RepID=A0A8H4RBT7_9HELO|nr:hypothetical protein G7Y89_g12140 [Cudoniella acicularis]
MLFRNSFPALSLVTTVAANFAVGRRATNTSTPAIPDDTFLKVDFSLYGNCLATMCIRILLYSPRYYLLPNGSRAHVPLMKYPATQQPSKGMILINPGGPGGSGIEEVFQDGAQFASIVGPNFDIVAWEPRGIQFSIPAASCSSSLTPIPGISKRSLNRDDKLYGSSLPQKFFEDAFEFDKELGATCQSLIGGPNGAGPHMSTKVVVQDMISILDAYSRSDEAKGVQDPSLLKYWGVSYGTVIGQTFASLFPDRVGRVILDGVVHADDYTSGEYLTVLEFSDEVFSTFFAYCHLAGPALCAYYTGTTAHDIFLRFEQTVGRLDAQKAFDQNWANASTISLALEGLKFYTRSTAYSPIANFPQLAQVLIILEQISRNSTAQGLQQIEDLVGQNITIGANTEWSYGVGCSDSGNVLFNQTLEDLSESIKNLEQESFTSGEYISALRVGCKFGASTKNPILFVSNTLDPITPISGGQLGTRLFNNSQLLTIDGTGHTSFGPLNKCAFAKVNAFFQNGTLPGKDNFCALEAGPFNVTISNGLKEGKRHTEDWAKIRRGMKVNDRAETKEAREGKGTGRQAGYSRLNIKSSSAVSRRQKSSSFNDSKIISQLQDLVIETQINSDTNPEMSPISGSHVIASPEPEVVLTSIESSEYVRSDAESREIEKNSNLNPAMDKASTDLRDSYSDSESDTKDEHQIPTIVAASPLANSKTLPNHDRMRHTQPSIPFYALPPSSDARSGVLRFRTLK